MSVSVGSGTSAFSQSFRLVAGRTMILTGGTINAIASSESSFGGGLVAIKSTNSGFCGSAGALRFSSIFAL